MNLALQNLSKAWGGLRVLDDVSLRVDGTGLTGLIGPNGAGKSTLFAAISGNVPVDRGSVSFGAQVLDHMAPSERARTGVMRTFQVPRPFARMSVRDNLVVASPRQPGESLRNVFFRPQRVRTREAELSARADEVLSELKLTALAKQDAGQLSGGQLKLLELGRLLMADAKLILLDEPFAGVNPVLAEELAERIRALNASGIGFFIVEHNLTALARLVTTLHAMSNGRVLASGTPDAVLADPAVRSSYLGD
ncbi:MAG TPA: ATP-binding cassette domain-containing protein [Casimicrobiaceae bacterium]|nr:ATP-binding cassette domain-containing protein [Casimicrobiaceae bacterium]